MGKSYVGYLYVIPIFAVLSMAPAMAETKWLPYQDNLSLQASRSLNKASLSPAIIISKPDSSIPQDIAFFSGIWAGSPCGAGNTEVKIAVRELSIEGASIVYSVGTIAGSFNNQEYDALVLDGELVGRTPSGGQIILGKRTKDKHLNIKWLRRDDKQRSQDYTLTCYGVLAREK